MRKEDRTICQTCVNSTDVLVNGTCMACQNGCNNCSFDTLVNEIICNSCSTGFYMKEKICEKCPIGCSSCHSETECTSCEPSYGMNGTICYNCNIDQCKYCEIPHGKTVFECKTCLPKRHLNADDCSTCPEFCKECSFERDFECKKCFNRYTKAFNGTCIPCPDNCENCKENSEGELKCDKCVSSSYHLQIDGTCKPCSDVTFQYCATCLRNQKEIKAECTSCENRFALSYDNLTCLPCEIKNCSLCVSNKSNSMRRKENYLTNFHTMYKNRCRIDIFLFGIIIF